VSRSRRLVLGAAVALVLALAGCAGGSTASSLPDGTGGTTGAPSPSAASPDGGGPVLTAYLAYWNAVLHAHQTTNPADPELARHAAGAELTKVRRAVALNRQQQISIRGTVTHQPRVASVTRTAAVVEDCYDVSGWDPVDRRTGKPIEAVDAGGTGRYKGRFGLRPGAGGWYVVSSATQGAC
jgi:hypothetical protein